MNLNLKIVENNKWARGKKMYILQSEKSKEKKSQNQEKAIWRNLDAPYMYFFTA